MGDRHLPTCICHDCLPGGAREHRVRPYGGVPAEDCEHGGADWARAAAQGAVTQAEVRYRVPLIGGGSILLCRLCGSILEREATP